MILQIITYRCIKSGIGGDIRMKINRDCDTRHPGYSSERVARREAAGSMALIGV